jgi:hypothetical protein
MMPVVVDVGYAGEKKPPDQPGAKMSGGGHGRKSIAKDMIVMQS